LQAVTPPLAIGAVRGVIEGLVCEYESQALKKITLRTRNKIKEGLFKNPFIFFLLKIYLGGIYHRSQFTKP
jgi:pheromone shutdown protein TraB